MLSNPPALNSLKARKISLFAFTTATVGLAVGLTLSASPVLAQAYPPAAGGQGGQVQPAPYGRQAQPDNRAYGQPPARMNRGPHRRAVRPHRHGPGSRMVQRRWHGLASFGVTRYTALGDRSFALRKRLGDRLEFEDSTGIDMFLGGSSPGGMFDLGLRINVSFGPLNRIAWENELGVQLESSHLFTFGPSALWHPFAGSRIDPYVGIDWLYTSLGTSKTASEEVCDDTGCDTTSVDVPFIRYSGWSFGYLAGVRFFLSSRGRPWWIHIEAKYLQSNWTNLEADDGVVFGDRPEDVSNMNLNQMGVTVGIGVAL